jgi:hypothetical protein
MPVAFRRLDALSVVGVYITLLHLILGAIVVAALVGYTEHRLRRRAHLQRRRVLARLRRVR